jgi:hypothetical protein
MNNRDRYLQETYSGKELLKKHQLDEKGTWEVRGEDPNCDLGGHHHMPVLGCYQGTLNEVIDIAVNSAGFWQWGGGGDIRLIAVESAKEVADRVRQRAALVEKVGAKRADIMDQIAELQAKLKALDD